MIPCCLKSIKTTVPCLSARSPMLYNLPFDVILLIISYVDGFRSITLLDSTALNKSLRKTYLELMRSEVFTIDFSMDSVLVSNELSKYIMLRDMFIISNRIKCKNDIIPELLERLVFVCFRKLLSLDLSGCTNLTNTLFNSQCFSSLTHLNLSKCLNLLDEGLITVAKFCPRLLSLDLSYCGNITGSNSLLK